MDPINYYLKFDCECKNYSHINCIDFNKYKKCLICKKHIKLDIISTQTQTQTQTQAHAVHYDVFNNIKWLKLFISISKVDKNFELLLDFLIKKKFILLFCIVSFIFAYGIIIPLYVVNVCINIVGMIFNKSIEKLKKLFFYPC